jgi:hypothetical protein
MVRSLSDDNTQVGNNANVRLKRRPGLSGGQLAPKSAIITNFSDRMKIVFKIKEDDARNLGVIAAAHFSFLLLAWLYYSLLFRCTTPRSYFFSSLPGEGRRLAVSPPLNPLPLGGERKPQAHLRERKP